MMVFQTIEAQVTNFIAYTSIDLDKDGLSDAYGTTGVTQQTQITDGILDYLDLDSDNDGILDSVETGIDTDADGIRNYDLIVTTTCVAML
jgi:hypothetical protein